ncbi:hypothetical protein OAW58_01095 [Candidatus Pelagibacter ubique]|nr:hypothetical protein [Candidatus Pelagibacter ubique]
MQFSKNTSNRSGKNLLIKIVFVLIIFIGAIVLLGKIEFPSPNKDIEKIIPNEKLKIVK